MNKLVFKSNKALILALTLVLCISVIGIAVALNNDIFTNVEQASSNNTNTNKTIGLSVSDNGYTITLNEVILDKNKLTIASTIKSDEKPMEGFPSLIESIYVNGENISSNSDSVADHIDDYTISQETTYFINNDIPIDANIKIEYSSLQLVSDLNGSTNIYGSWVFDFNANSNELIKRN